MKTLQTILGILSLIMSLGMFGFNLWIGANFSKGLALPQCYTPMNYISAALVLVTVVTIFLRK